MAMRRFIDLHIKAPEEPDGVRPMLELAARLGYKGVCLTLEGSHPRDLGDMASGVGIDLVSRVDLTPRNASELTATLRKDFEITEKPNPTVVTGVQIERNRSAN